MLYSFYFIFIYIAFCACVQFNNNRVYEGYPVVITCTAFMVPSTPVTKNMTCIRLLKLQWYNRSEGAYSLLAWHRYVEGKLYDSHVFVKRKNWMFKFSSHDVTEGKCDNKGTIKLQMHILEAELGEAGEYQCQKVYVGVDDVFTKADTLFVIPYAGTTKLVQFIAVVVAASISCLITLAIIIGCFCRCCRRRRDQESATDIPRARRGTQSDFQWHVEDPEIKKSNSFQQETGKLGKMKSKESIKSRSQEKIKKSGSSINKQDSNQTVVSPVLDKDTPV